MNDFRKTEKKKGTYFIRLSIILKKVFAVNINNKIFIAESLRNLYTKNRKKQKGVSTTLCFFQNHRQGGNKSKFTVYKFVSNYVIYRPVSAGRPGRPLRLGLVEFFRVFFFVFFFSESFKIFFVHFCILF